MFELAYQLVLKVVCVGAFGVGETRYSPFMFAKVDVLEERHAMLTAKYSIIMDNCKKSEIFICTSRVARQLSKVVVKPY